MEYLTLPMASAPTPAPARRVVVIDDDASVRALCAAMLREAGFDPVPVSDAPSYARAFSEPVTAVVVAESVPWAPAASVRAAVPGRPTVLLAGRDAVAEGFRAGFDDVVPRAPDGFVSLPSVVVRLTSSVRASSSGAGLAKLLDRLDRATFRCDASGRLLDANRAFVELLGFGLREDALRANAFDVLLPGARRPGFEKRLLDSKFVRESGVELSARDGIPLRLDVAFAVDDDGSVAGLAERAVVASTAPVPATPALPDPKLARALGVAHDLKEPLRTLVRSAEVLQQRVGKTLDAESAEELAWVTDAAKRMQGQVRRLFDPMPAATDDTVSGASEPLPADDLVEEGESCDASVVLRDVLAGLRASLEASGASVTSDPLPEVAVAADQLGPVLQNLVSNALKFRRPNASPRVHVKAFPDGAQVRFSVTDDGIGIAKEHHASIFKMFQRGDAAGRYPGSGIGLSVCQRIVERHGGRLWVESAPGQGATFFFTLPAAEKTALAAPIPLRPRRA